MIITNKAREYSEVKDDNRFNSNDDTYRPSTDEKNRRIFLFSI